MDDRRFDQLVKAVASGASRRSVLKGMLGLGGAALVGSAALDPDVDAARRPTPTPAPIRCPGNQQPGLGGVCTCPATAPNKCGPDCCTGIVTDPYPRAANHSECCDNACCFGTCYGEELCCPTNGRAGELPPTHQLCDGADGPECCLFEQACCSVDGCCDTFCYGGPVEDSFCCPDAQACPGGDASDDDCCNVGETCCGGGTNENYCADLSTGGCCEASDCAPQEGACAMACVAGQCEPTTCPEGQICCLAECVSSSEYSVCPVDPEECCSTAGGFICCGTGGCCLSTRCNEINGDCCASEAAVCRVEGGCCTPPQECCLGETCCDPGKCTTGGTCCTGDDIVCAGNCCPAERCVEGQGCCDEGDIACGGICCDAGEFFCNAQQQCECHPGTGPCSLLPGPCCPLGQCNNDFVCCPDGTSPCGVDCCDNLTQTCNVASGACECAGGAILCNGACIVAECCANDTTACASLGYDPECVLCVNGDCTDAGTEFLPCSTFDINQGWCNNGFCVGCLFDGEGCDESSQCCSNNCVQGTCELD